MIEANADRLSQDGSAALHLTGAIQPHGALLVADGDGCITHASDNVDAFLGRDAGSLLGTSLPPELIALGRRIGLQPGLRLLVENAIVESGARLDAVLTRVSDSGLLVELTRHVIDDDCPYPAFRRATAHFQFASEADVVRGRQQLIDDVRRLTGASKTLYCVFHDDEHGEVLAESAAAPAAEPAIETATVSVPASGAQAGPVSATGSGAIATPEPDQSLVGSHFPAADLPMAARRLYLRNQWRFIPDAAAESVPIVCQTATQSPDLSHAALRSVSPAHRAYLSSMGARASLMIAVPVADRLAGIVVAHAPDVLPVSAALIDHVGQRVASFARALSTWRAVERLRASDEFTHQSGTVRRWLREHGGIEAAWPLLSAWLMQQFDADGAMWVQAGATLGTGLTLDADSIEAIRHAAGVKAAGGAAHSPANDGVWMTDRVHEDVPGPGAMVDAAARDVAGIALLTMGSRSIPGGTDHAPALLVLTRRADDVERPWAGSGREAARVSSSVLGPAPVPAAGASRLFTRWRERSRDRARPWHATDRARLDVLRTLLAHEATR